MGVKGRLAGHPPEHSGLDSFSDLVSSHRSEVKMKGFCSGSHGEGEH